MQRDPATATPVLILGVSRSGTTLLKEMLSGASELAIPSESYFIPQLWDRHGERPDREAFLDDLERLPRIREWGVPREAIEARMPERPSFAEAVGAVYAAYAELHGRRRWGDKTPSYMEELELLERAFPGAQYVHLIRDGRDAGLSFLAMRRRPRFNWARPRGLGGFAAQWRREVGRARALGRRLGPARYREVRYEELVADPEATIRELCEFLGLAFEPEMLEYQRRFAAERPVDHARLARAPAAGARDWRAQLSARGQRLFEAVAGDMLAELGLERRYPRATPRMRIRGWLERAALAVRIASFDAATRIVRSGPLWRLRQAYTRRTHVEGTP